jgi:hypothetical protein
MQKARRQDRNVRASRRVNVKLLTLLALRVRAQRRPARTPRAGG